MALASSILAVLPAQAEPTRVAVRVLSKDAKFIGTATGGARILIRDADTGEMLAQGVTRGSTGDTGRIMREPRQRGVALATPGSARFDATLDLQEPRRIEIEATGPLAQPQAAGRAAVTLWLIPGKHLEGGDGVLLELPGFALDILAPPAHVRLKGPQQVQLRVNLVLMCGCPVEPGGLWDANRYEVKALLRRDDQPAGEASLRYAGSTSQFEGAVDAQQPGVWEVLVYAYDPATGNTGVDRTTFVIE
jgi:hypothetical protein